MTYFILGTVIEVSATLVDKITRSVVCSLNILLARIEVAGRKVEEFQDFVLLFRRTLEVSFISRSLLKKTKISLASLIPLTLHAPVK